MPKHVPARHAIAAENTWDTHSVFSSDDAWEHAIGELDAATASAAQYRGRVSEGPEVVRALLDTVYDLLNRARKVYLYATMQRDVDTTDQRATALLDRALGVTSNVQAALSFVEPELLALGSDTLGRWATEDARLALYAQYFNELNQRRAHIRSAEVEELLGHVREPFHTATTIHGTLVDSELRFEPAVSFSGEAVEIAQGNINSLLASEDRALRRTAWESYSDAHLQWKNTLASCIAAGVKQNVFVARARRYTSALEAALAPNFIPVNVFHSLLDTYKQHLPIWHRYWRVRRQALGYNKLHVYDIKAPLTKHEPHVPFAQATHWIAQGMRPLGDEYVVPMQRGVLEQRWVDKYPNQGKRSGAYSTGARDTHPFILMSYTDDLASMSTLAHELGHSMHSYFTRQTQPPPYASYTIFLAEVASNFNQALVRDFLLKQHAEPQFQIAVLEEAMNNFHRYFFIMPTLARFELALHQRAERGQPLNADVMIGLMSELFAEGYGGEVELDADRIGITWAEFPTHMYLNFYVFQYATGIAGAHALAEQVLAGEHGAVERYMQFLQSGRSRYPLDTLRAAGVDLASPEPVERTFGVLNSYVARLEALTGVYAAKS